MSTKRQIQILCIIAETWKQPGALRGKMVKQTVVQPHHGILLRSEKGARCYYPHNRMTIRCSYAEWKRQTQER